MMARIRAAIAASGVMLPLIMALQARRPAADEAPTTTFTRDVAPILFEHDPERGFSGMSMDAIASQDLNRLLGERVVE